MLEVEITTEMDKKATAKSGMHGNIRNSIRKGMGNLVGYLGEEIVLATVEDCIEHNTFNYDMIRFPDSDFQYSIDVKTKERTVEPRPFYTTHVAKTSMHQDVDGSWGGCRSKTTSTSLVSWQQGKRIHLDGRIELMGMSLRSQSSTLSQSYERISQLHEEAQVYRRPSTQERFLSSAAQLRDEQQDKTERDKQVLQQGIHSPHKTN